MNSMDKCCNNRNGGCYLTNELGSTSFARECPFSKQAQKHCELYAPASFCKGASKVSSMEKRAAWADVAAKARAIVASGGVNLIEENASEIEAVVTSYQVASEFPVYMGGPYDVILSKRSWTNQENVGGWIQGYLCSCEWGHYNSGEPGPRWQGRFCAHAYATLLVANARARNEFTRNRMASMFVMGECCECGGYKDVSVTTGMCQECQDAALFDAVVAAYQNKANAEHEALIQAVAEEELDEVSEEMEITPIDEKTSMLTWGDHKAVVTSKGEYPTFSDWEWDAVRSGYMSRVAYEDGPWTQKIKTDAGNVYLELNGDMWCLYPSEEFAENYDMDPDPNTGGPFEEFKASDPDEASVLAQSLLEEDWGLRVGSKTAGRRKPPSKDDFELDFWGSMEQMVCTKGSYKYEMGNGPKGWGWCVRNKSDDTIVDQGKWEENYPTWEEAYDAMVQNSRVFARRTAMTKDATRHFTYAEMQELEDEIIGRELHNTDRFKA